MNWVTSDNPKFTDVQQFANDILALIGYGYIHYVSTLEEAGQYEIALGGLHEVSTVIFEVGWLELENARFKNIYDAFVLHSATRILDVSPRPNQTDDVS